MKTPKLLPWYARKAGVPIERAEALWHKAVREATADIDVVGDSEFWGSAVDRLHELLDEEQNTLCAPHTESFVRSQHRMWLLPLLAAEDVYKAMAANWQRHCKQMSKAA